MQSTSPPPPPPYASKHTIIAAPPAVSSRSSLTSLLSPTSKSPSPDPSGHRVSTALNITFSPPPASDGSCGFTLEQPRHHVVQRVSTPPPPPVNSSSSTVSIVNAIPTEWMPERTLRGKTFYKDQDKIYCEEDYLYWGFQQMAEKCTVCDHIIAPTIVRAMGKSYHPGCFRCTICNNCMEKQPFTVDQEGHIFCLYDYYLATAPTCAACANPILPDSTADEVLRVVAMNKEFHIDCYRCEDCDILLSDEVSSRCYPYVETGEGGTPGRTHLLCLKCHLARIGATPAPGQNLDSLPLQRRRRSSNGSSSLASSSDLRVPGSVSLTHSSGSGERSSPYSTERRTIAKPWSSTGRSGYYGTESDGR
ncbi:unnamed protein product [Hydatigera taeniaeformis]|uniref:LIM zinc-binding domain-containing protein n=1 Tax=Hydatigena taeniaeformis TaxID=6205 RepID=A0A0R3WL75_HYDTA|nr:unnamed protein product [Hydatigera taeniaeformis]